MRISVVMKRRFENSNMRTSYTLISVPISVVMKRRFENSNKRTSYTLISVPIDSSKRQDYFLKRL
jgi:hypothetical protein